MKHRPIYIVAAALAVLSFSSASAQEQEFDVEDVRYVVDGVSTISPFELGETLDPYMGGITLTHDDVILRGTGPEIRLSRRFSVGRRDETAKLLGEMGNWYLSIPSMNTWVAATERRAQDNDYKKEWAVEQIGHVDRYARCSSFQQPPGSREESARHWWEGVSLRDQNFLSELILMRSSDGKYPVPAINQPNFPTSYPLLTKGGWVIGCLSATANGVPGEGFLAISPQGFRYWFNHIVYKEGYPSSPVSYEGRSYRTLRDRAYAYVTRIEDQFGNFVTYKYGPYGPVNISASDGRQVNIDWDQQLGVVSRIVANPGHEQRVFLYTYSAGDDGTNRVLSTVRLPDASRWTFTSPPWTYMKTRATSSLDCVDLVLYPDRNDVTTPFVVNTPSGLTATYSFKVVGRGRSFAQRKPGGPIPGSGCLPANKYHTPRSLISKSYQGPGVDQSWTYSYEVNSTFSDDCELPGANCRDYTRTTINNPNGSRDVLYVNNKNNSRIEGLLMKAERYGVGAELLETELYAYATSDSDLVRFKVGNLYYGIETDGYREESNVPLVSRQTLMNGNTYTWRVDEFDGMARPTKVSKFSGASQ
ncbi:hypothetical protein [Pseudoxanthomonas wuyuanensis]|uniref:YD repeat-containing protein n=1 Tax=Pseudoxanthomonas wuyuanensis TaxID=1073196 RepID=A0A286DBH8_9GAMM|nr:hypothetical protein [Pseudoxanthomonas wuyuanensis]SOD56020.1 hypothetical protein SAMN06296416_108135 [Pseudoxanthomonas wuyuanensis]